MKILLTGVGGYLGTVMCEMLLNEGYEVIGVDRFFFGIDRINHLTSYINFKHIRIDVRDIDKKLLEEVDTIIDLAGISNDPAVDLDNIISKSINLDGTLRLASLAKESAVKQYFFSSSCSVYGEGSDKILNEESRLAPVSLYAHLKTQAEDGLLKLADSKFNVTILRNGTIYGYSSRMRFDLIVNLMTLHAYKNGKIFITGGGNQWRPLIHVKDVSKAFLLLTKTNPEKINKQVFNVGSNEQNFKVVNVANYIKEIMPNTIIEMVPDDIDKRSYHVCFDKIKNELDFEVNYSLKDGIKEIRDSLLNGLVNHEDLKCYTVKYYKYLIDAEKILLEIKYNGKLF